MSLLKTRVSSGASHSFLIKIRDNPFYCFLFLVPFSLLISYVVATFGILGGALSALLIVGVPVLYGIFRFPKFGLLLLLFLAYTIMFFYRLPINYPLGTVIDGLILLLLLGFMFAYKQNPDPEIFKSQISVIIFIWIGYNLIEILNPAAASRLTWLYAIRPIALFMVTFYVFSYYIKTVEFVRTILKLWLALAFFAALYGIKQRFFGFFDFEYANINTPEVRSLLFINGVWRYFSIFSDPVSFSYNMVVGCLLCVGLLTKPQARWKKLLLIFMGVVFITSMLYSGTRGAYVLLPAALVLLFILKFNKKIMVVMVIGCVSFVGLIFVPTSNLTLYRFQSAFKPSEDASYNVRKMNQKRIQPFILSHPLGGGLGGTEVFGKRFAPGSFLANFPPDSGYIRVAAELGWIGLFIFCAFMFIVLKTGINSYFLIQDPELKSYCLAMLLIAFALNFGNFPQEALVQFPTSIYFYLTLALLNVTYRIDREKRLTNNVLK